MIADSPETVFSWAASTLPRFFSRRVRMRAERSGCWWRNLVETPEARQTVEESLMPEVCPQSGHAQGRPRWCLVAPD